MKVLVSFETRKRGAIGEFETRHVVVEANTRRDAYVFAQKEFHDMDLETRFPLGLKCPNCNSHIDT